MPAIASASDDLCSKWTTLKWKTIRSSSPFSKCLYGGRFTDILPVGCTPSTVLEWAGDPPHKQRIENIFRYF